MQLEQAKVMHSSLAKCSADDLSVSLIDHHLCFQDVPPFLATVVYSLFFRMLNRTLGDIPEYVNKSETE